MQIQQFTFNAFQENTFVVYDDNTKEGVIIDPGCYESFEEKELKEFVEDKGIKIVKVLNTHCHVDHVLGNFWAVNTFKVPLLICKEDEETLKSVKAYAPSYGFDKYTEVLPDEYLKEGDVVTFGAVSLSVYFVPGHAPGHIVFYDKESKQCIGGDVLFQMSIGRTDLPGGDLDTLLESIKTKMFALPDDTVVFPGHGPTTTIGFEKSNNPFCKIN